jgi:hypothetical protein
MQTNYSNAPGYTAPLFSESIILPGVSATWAAIPHLAGLCLTLLNLTYDVG